MGTQLRAFMQQHQAEIEAALERHLPRSATPRTGTLNAAVEHAVFTGGKRMRPVLCLASARVCGRDMGDALKVAAALEYLHSASLIFDDLPCMDDSLERRGEDSVHVRFGEGVAVLAGLALLNMTYGLLSEADGSGALMREAVRCIGHDGMIAGQLLDLKHTRVSSLEALETPYLKTTALLKLALTAAPIALGASRAEIDALARFGHRLGMAYQLLDDALDRDVQTVSVHEPAAVAAAARRWLDEARAALTACFQPGPARDVLLEFAESVWSRAMQDVGTSRS